MLEFRLGSGRFPEFTEPNPGYHGLVYHDALGATAYIAKLESKDYVIMERL
jgi:O-acetylhomoserine (thiol)-lyase